MKDFKSIAAKLILALLLLSVTIFLMKSCDTVNTVDNQLLGSWSLKEVNWISADTTHILKKDKLGMLLLTEDSYSIMWSPIQKERTPFKELSNPTDEEIINGFRSIVFNAGIYMATDSTLTTTSIIAKVPGFESGKQFYTHTVNNNFLTLTMTDEVYPNGRKPSWSGTWQTKFIFHKKKK